jgi:uncharacterized membrane protein
MTLEPLLQAPLAIQIHVATVVPAFLIGTWLILVSRKGGPRHRLLGWVYLGLMTITAVAAIFIAPHIGPTVLGFGPIHLFVALVFIGIYNAIQGVRRHDIHRHAGAMIGVYVGAILIAGGLTFLPGRIMHEVFLS